MSIQPIMKRIGGREQFDGHPVTEGQVQALLEEAVWAPNHHLREPWRFIWVAGDYRAKLADLFDLPTHAAIQGMIMEAPACLIVVAPVPEDAREAGEDFAAACCLIQNLQILASASGLGMEWHLPLREECRAFCTAAGLEQHERIAGVLGLGYFKDEPAKKPGEKPLRIDIV